MIYPKVAWKCLVTLFFMVKRLKVRTLIISLNTAQLITNIKIAGKQIFQEKECRNNKSEDLATPIKPETEDPAFSNQD